MTTIYGTYQKTIFFNQENGRTAFLLNPAQLTKNAEYQKCLDKNGCIKCMGYFSAQQKDLPLKLEGEFEDSEYGLELNFDSVDIQAISRDNSELYLVENSPTLQKRQIRQLLDVTGDDIFSACREKGIEEKVCKNVKADELDIYSLFEFVRGTLDELELFKLLQHYGGTYDQATKIMAAFPGKSVDQLLEDPYAILDKVKIPFKVIDQIAISSGVQKTSLLRIQAVAYEIIRQQKNAGNVFLTLDDISHTANKLCEDMPKASVGMALNDHPYITRDPDSGFYYDKNMLADEKNAAGNFARLMKTRKALPWHPEYIAKIEEEQGYQFGGEQKQAFMLLKTTGFKLLTGDPGTGKTSTLNGLLRYLEMLWLEEYKKEPIISLCAPSGRAAQRMKETTGRVAQTIHKLIDYQPYGDREYYRNASDPLEADIVVVDESSMMGLSIFNKLISAIKNGALVLIIGDTNQLQSVDPGDVLTDIIKCGYVDSCHLTETFRQAKNSCINMNAKKIMQGDVHLITGGDFEIIECRDDNMPELMLGTVRRLMQTAPKESIQVLAPTHKGSCGVFEGNKMLQALMNPKKTAVSYGRTNYKEGDRIIMTNNNYALSYYNGDIGYIQKIGEASMTVKINEEDIVIPKSNYSDMDLAYFTTVHKAQGSEYDYVVIVLQKDAAGMLNRNLFYTAVTRGKKKVIVLAEDGMIEKAVTTYRKYDRNSLLADRIDQEIQHRIAH